MDWGKNCPVQYSLIFPFAGRYLLVKRPFLKRPFSLTTKTLVFLSLFFILAVVDSIIFINIAGKIGSYDVIMDNLTTARGRFSQIAYELDIYVLNKSYEKGVGVDIFSDYLTIGERSLKDIETKVAETNPLMQKELNDVWERIRHISGRIKRLLDVKDYEEAITIHNNVDLEISFIMASIDSIFKSSSKERQAEVDDIRKNVILVLVISIFIGIISLLIFLKTVILPIQMAAQIAIKARLDMRGPKAEPTDEVGTIVNTLVDMVSGLKDVFVDVEKRIDAETKEFDKKTKRLAVINNIANTTLHSFKEEEILKTALDEIIGAIDIDAGAAYLRVSENNKMGIKAHKGFSNAFVDAVRVMNVGDGFCGHAEILKEPTVIDMSSYEDKRLKPLLSMEGIETAVCAPIVHKDLRLGGFFLASKKRGRILSAEIPFIEVVAQTVGAAIENANIFQREYQSGMFLERFINQLPVSIMIFDRNGVCAKINPACMRMLGIERESEVVARYNILKDNILKDKGLSQRIRDVFEGEGCKFTIDYDIGKVWHIDLKGREIKLKATMFPTFGLDGKPANAVVMYEDVTESERFKEQFFHAEKIRSIGKAIGSIAHELNNPLTGMMGYSQILLKKDMPQEIKEVVEKIESGARRAYQIIQNLLEVSRGYKLKRESFNLNETIEKTASFKSQELKKSGIEIILELDKELSHITGDNEEIRHVFFNIINNARDAIISAGSKGRIIVRSRCIKKDGKEFVGIDFIDNGTGISNESMERLFEPFFTTKPDAAGLGLAVAYRIVMDHGGRIEARNNPQGGAAFTVELPVPFQAESRKETQVFEKEGKGVRILIVDDEPAVLDIFRTILSNEGYSIITTSNGSEAMNMVLEGRWDAVITDVKMPGMNGRELYHTATEKNPALKGRFIFSTGDTGGEGFAQFLKETGCPTISKPFDIARVKEFIKEFIGKQILGGV